jgi:hypothetical protein
VLFGVIALCLGGGLIAAAGMQVYANHRRCDDAAAWILVSNVNTLLRLDLDHLTGDDENAGLRELRVALKEIAAKRPDAERRLFERFNALVGVAITFGEKVHDASGTVDLRAVANRRAHLQNALALGDRIEAALGGIAELARDGQPARDDSTATAGEAVRKTSAFVRRFVARARAERETRPAAALPAFAGGAERATV